jgi:hypothetical protein
MLCTFCKTYTDRGKYKRKRYIDLLVPHEELSTLYGIVCLALASDQSKKFTEKNRSKSELQE